MDNSNSSLQCFWSNLKDHPECSHGPTLLFGQCINNEWTKFYLCSACRERKLCPFFLNYKETLSKDQKKSWEQKRKQLLSMYNQQKLHIRFHELMATYPSKRAYCHTCEKLLAVSEKNWHKDHELIENLSDHQMLHPTEILKPLSNVKKEAQYLFSEKSTKDIVNFLLDLGAEQVLCIGTPRIYEYITNNVEAKMSALLLDFDGRFHNFFGYSYCWYNLFNHHFFFDDAKSTFKDFLTQNNGRNTYVVCDPPFGGRVEAMSQTLKRISDCYKKWNKLENDDAELKVLFIFPYFMESIMRHKANLPSITGGLKDLKMIEYQVEYDNHPLFFRKDNKMSSPVRIFTNVPLNLFKLSEAEGYKYCKRCDRWVTSANKHCKKCKNCTSKDGKRYKHCNTCQRCVKATWEHCKTCQRCTLVQHKCGQQPKVTGLCFKCNLPGHTEKNCQIEIVSSLESILNKKLKRKIQENNENDIISKKKVKKDKHNQHNSNKISNKNILQETFEEKSKIFKFQKLEINVNDNTKVLLKHKGKNLPRTIQKTKNSNGKKTKKKSVDALNIKVFKNYVLRETRSKSKKSL